MAEIVPGGIRVQAIWQGRSGLPEDRYVNTFHFADVGGGPTVEADLVACIERVKAFYYGTQPFTGQTVINYLAKLAIDLGASELRAYDLSQPAPREPVFGEWAAWTEGSNQPAPSEVAVCLSFRGIINVPSSRGRVYLGPLGVNAIQTGSAPAQVNQSFQQTLTQAGKVLMLGSGSIWSILGHPGGAGPSMITVTDGWVDNAFDTQRRRGEDATGRFTFANVT